MFTRFPVFSAMQVGVPVVPGTPGAVEKYQDGDAFVKEYGFPSKQVYLV